MGQPNPSKQSRIGRLGAGALSHPTEESLQTPYGIFGIGGEKISPRPSQSLGQGRMTAPRTSIVDVLQPDQARADPEFALRERSNKKIGMDAQRLRAETEIDRLLFLFGE